MENIFCQILVIVFIIIKIFFYYAIHQQLLFNLYAEDISNKIIDSITWLGAISHRKIYYCSITNFQQI